MECVSICSRGIPAALREPSCGHRIPF